MNDGGALMAFQIRGGQAEKRWAGGTLRSADGKMQILEPKDVEFQAGRRWVLEALRGAGFDHPVLPAFPEGDYLKFAIGRVLQ